MKWLFPLLLLIALPARAQIMWPAECIDSLDARRIIDHRVWICQDSKLVPLASTITGPTVNVKLTNGTQTWYEPLPVPHRTTDRAYWLHFALTQAATIADIENTRYALGKAGTQEANPIYGKAPSRLTLYSISEAVAIGNAIFDRHYKRQDDALAAANIPGHKWSKWWVPTMLNTAAHSVGLLTTLASTGR